MNEHYIKTIIISYGDNKPFKRSFADNYAYVSHIGHTIKVYTCNEKSINVVLEFSDSVTYIIEYW